MRVEVKRVDPKETNMLALCMHLADAINRYLTYYMPTNRAVGWLRSPRGLKWTIPVALVATPGYLFAMSVCMTVIERGGPGYINVLVMLFAWDAIKFGLAAVYVAVRWAVWICWSRRPRRVSERGYVDHPLCAG